MKNLIYLNEDELKNINGGAVGDGAETIGIMTGSIARWGPIVGNFVGSYKIFERFFSIKN
ncbi:bacteriocin [Tenacibaculum maritimum]|uniref:bacteriocin n=2 Tax=Tenacibaculum maritimum TaxID=107401 RepID=UPI00389106C2